MNRPAPVGDLRARRGHRHAPAPARRDGWQRLPPRQPHSPAARSSSSSHAGARCKRCMAAAAAALPRRLFTGSGAAPPPAGLCPSPPRPFSSRPRSRSRSRSRSASRPGTASSAAPGAGNRRGVRAARGPSGGAGAERRPCFAPNFWLRSRHPGPGAHNECRRPGCLRRERVISPGSGDASGPPEGSSLAVAISGPAAMARKPESLRIRPLTSL